MTSVIVVDFDGTLVPFNSFPKWVSHLLRRSSFRQTLPLMSALSLLAARKARVISHSQFKGRLCQIAEHLDPTNSFGSWLNQRVDWGPIVEAIKPLQIASEAAVCVCSAAPDYYLRAIESTFPFTHPVVIGSRWEGTGFIDNLGEQKLRSLIHHFGRDLELVAAFSDHHEDIPLLQASRHSFLVNPSECTARACASAGIAFTVIS